jgi:hypothetical protein
MLALELVLIPVILVHRTVVKSTRSVPHATTVL